MMVSGARGVISTTSNLLPKAVSEVTKLALSGGWREARLAHMALLPVYEAMFVEASPAPVKFAMSLRGRCSSSVRAPLVVASEGARVKITEAVRRYEAST
jgi:4-hydroxy-tetrahydrodipicolinate synthase